MNVSASPLTRGMTDAPKSSPLWSLIMAAQLIYPHHIRELTKTKSYTYDWDSLAMKELGGETLSQFLATMAFVHFDDRLKDEWTKLTAGKTSLPMLQEMFKLFEPPRLNWKTPTLFLCPSSRCPSLLTAGKPFSVTPHSKGCDFQIPT